MNDELITYLSRYISISEELVDILLKSSFVKLFPKGTILLRTGDQIKSAYFILKGCIRSYTLKNGEEKTIDFFIEEDPVRPLGYGTDIPSIHFLQCLEDTLAVVNSPEQEEKAFIENPELKSVCFAMTKIMTDKLQNNLARFKTSTAEERYTYLVENRPDLFQRIPQYLLASYLGIKPESLSRIRKRLS